MTARRVPVQPSSPAPRNAIALWADATTAPGTTRRGDLLRDKTAITGVSRRSEIAATSVSILSTPTIG